MKAIASVPLKKANINDTYSDCMEIKAGGNNRLFCPSGQKQKYLIKKHFQYPDDPHGGLIFDEAGFPKKGDDSIGVGKQYCGSSPDFIEAVEEHPGLCYFVSVPSDTYFWLTMPITRKKKYKYKCQIREKTVLDSTEKKPSPRLPWRRTLMISSGTAARSPKKQKALLSTSLPRDGLFFQKTAPQIRKFGL